MSEVKAIYLWLIYLAAGSAGHGGSATAERSQEWTGNFLMWSLQCVCQLSWYPEDTHGGKESCKENELPEFARV